MSEEEEEKEGLDQWRERMEPSLLLDNHSWQYRNGAESSIACVIYK